MSSVVKEIEGERQRISVLLVEDQAMVIEGVRRLLATDPTIAFHYVSDPALALASIIRIGPTVILQDLVMPGVNGLDLVREYRNDPTVRNVPVIILSSKEDPANKQTAFESGANDYMVKMPHRIELLARVRLHSEAYINELQRKRAFQDPKFARLSILVVDDINVNRRVCVAQLQKLGVQKISEAENGRKAIAAAQTQVFDLILMDVQMPEIDGLQATQRIRVLLPSTKQPRIIGLTANGQGEQRETCLAAGMDDKLTKPLRIDELRAVLEAIAGGDQT